MAKVMTKKKIVDYEKKRNMQLVQLLLQWRPKITKTNMTLAAHGIDPRGSAGVTAVTTSASQGFEPHTTPARPTL